MGMRARKLVGTILLLVLVAGYSLAVVVMAGALLPEANKAIELAFYAVAGLAWVLPAAVVVRWMQR